MVMNTFKSKLRRRRDELFRRGSDESDEWQFVPFNPSVYPANNNNNHTFNNNDGGGGISLERMGREGEKGGRRGREGEKEGDFSSSSSPKPALRPWALKRASWHENYPPVPPHGHGSVVRRSFPLPRPPSRDSSPPPLPPHGQGYPGSVPPWYGAQFLHMASVNYPASVPPGQSRPENVAPRSDVQPGVSASDSTVSISSNALGQASASLAHSASSVSAPSVSGNAKQNTQSRVMGSTLFQGPIVNPTIHPSVSTSNWGSLSNAFDHSAVPGSVSGPGTSPRPNSGGSQLNSTSSVSADGVSGKESQHGSICSDATAGVQISPEGTPPPVPPHGRPTVPPHVVSLSVSAVGTLPPMPTLPLPPPPVPAHAQTEVHQRHSVQSTNQDKLHQNVASGTQTQDFHQQCPNSQPLKQLQHQSIQSVNPVRCLQENQQHPLKSDSAINSLSQPIDKSINHGTRELVSPGQAPPKYAHLNLDHLALFLGSVVGDKDPSPPPPPPPPPQHETSLLPTPQKARIANQVTVMLQGQANSSVQPNSNMHGPLHSEEPPSVLQNSKVTPRSQKNSKVHGLQNSKIPSSGKQNAVIPSSELQASKLPPNLKTINNVPPENPTSPGSPEYKTPVDQLPEYQSPTRGSPTPPTTPMRNQKHNKIPPTTQGKNKGNAYIPPSPTPNRMQKNNVPATQIQNSRNAFVSPPTSSSAQIQNVGIQSQGNSHVLPSVPTRNHNHIIFPQTPGNSCVPPSPVPARAQVQNPQVSHETDLCVPPIKSSQRVVAPPPTPSRSLSADSPSQYFTSKTFSRETPSPAFTKRTYSMDNPPPTPTRTLSVENPPPTPTRTLSMENPSPVITSRFDSIGNPTHSVSSSRGQSFTARAFSTASTTGNHTHTRTQSTGSITVENLGHPFFAPRTFSMECPGHSFAQRSFTMESPPPVPTRTLSLGNVSAEQPPPTPTRTLSKEHSNKFFSTRNLAMGNPSTTCTPVAPPAPHNQYTPHPHQHHHHHPQQLSFSSHLPTSLLPPSSSHVSLHPTQSSFLLSSTPPPPSQSFLPPFQSALPPSLSCPLLPSPPPPPPSHSFPLLPSPSSLPPSPSSLPPYQSLLPLFQSALPPSLSFPLLPSPPSPLQPSSHSPSTQSSLLPSQSLPLLPSPFPPPSPPTISSPLDLPPPPPTSRSEEESLHLLLPPPLFMSTNLQINKDSQVD